MFVQHGHWLATKHLVYSMYQHETLHELSL